MQKLQEEINKVEKGIILEVKLLNIDELNILIDDISAIMQKFNNVIESICKKEEDKSIVQIVKISDPSKLYIILQGDLSIADQLAHKIYHAVQIYIDEDYPESYFKCSIGGIKFDNSSSKNIEILLSKLNYNLKIFENYSNYHLYERDAIDLESLRAQNVNLNLFRVALLKNQVRFFYQPVINSKTRRLEYYECLLRVPNKQGEYFSAGPVIQYAEGKGLVNLIDLTVVEMAVKQLVQDKNLKLSINISNIGVLNKELLVKINQLLTNFDVAHRLIIEITETTFNQDFITTKDFINVLHSYGCLVALDDFGSGYTSFSQILELPIDIIKIDGKYVKDILINHKHRIFVEALINLAHKLNIKTTAEFVESNDIAELLTKMNVCSMQGNYFSAALKDLDKSKVIYKD